MIITVDRLIAAIAAALPEGHTGKTWSKGGHERIYVTRYARQERGYVSYRADDDGEIDVESVDTGALNIAGMGRDSVRAAILASL